MTFDDTILVHGAHNLGVPLDSEQRAMFGRFYALLREENDAAGLTTVLDPDGVQRRHFLESIALGPALAREKIASADASMVDVGSGGGFPGVPLAIVNRAARVTLVEGHGRRAAFLRRVVDELSLNERARVIQSRAEDAGRDPAERERYDIALARAVAPLATLAELTLPFVRVGGALVAIKGSRAPSEVVDAEFAIAELGGGQARSAPLPLPDGIAEHPPVIIVVPKVAPTPDRYPRRSGVPAKRPLRERSGRRRMVD